MLQKIHKKRIISGILLLSLIFGITFADDQTDVMNDINNMRNATRQPGILGDIFTKVFDTNGKIKEAFLYITATATDYYIPMWSGLNLIDSPIYSTGGLVGIGTTTLTEELTLSGGLSITSDPDSDDDVGDRGYNDARYQEDIGAVSCVYGISSINDIGTVVCATNNDTTISDTNAGTICLVGEYLDGDGTCKTERYNSTIDSSELIDNTITETDISDSFKARDSDKLDNLNSLQFLRSDTDVILNGRLQVNNGSNGDTYNTAPIEILEDWDSGTGEGPHLSFHYGGAVASQIGFMKGDNSGDISILNNPGTSYETLRAGEYKVGTTVVVGSDAYLEGDRIRQNTVDDSEVEDNSLTALSLADNSVGNGELDNSQSYEMSTLSLNGSRLKLGRDGAGYGWIQSLGTASDIDRVTFGFKNDVTTGLVTQTEIYSNGVPGLVLDSSSNVGIGTNIPDYKLDVIGKIQGDYLYLNAQDGTNEGGEMRFDGAGSWGNIQIDNYQGNLRVHTLATGKYLDVLGGAGVRANGHITNSDRRLKKDIVPLKSSLEKINELNGYNFTWKETGTRDIGIIAQEVEKVFPNLVLTNDDNEGMKSVKYSNLVAPIIEAIKELTFIIDDLYERYLSQENKIKELEKRLSKVESKL